MKAKKPLSNSEIATFCNQVSLLFQAGIPPAECMNILLTDTNSPEGKSILEKIYQVCLEGEPFYKALASTQVFPDYVIQMLALGEESGNLDVCLRSLADYYEKEESIAESFKSAVTYPLIMILMMLIVIFVLISKVMPIFQTVFQELGSDMTGFASSLLSLGNKLNHYSVGILTVVCIVALLGALSFRLKSLRRKIGHFFQKLPFIRQFYEGIACGRFASGMALCLKSGMDIYSSFDMTAQLIENESVKEKVALCRESLNQGNTFTKSLKQTGLFSNLHLQMIDIGSQTGNVDQVLSQIALQYERSTDKKIQTLISVLEPSLVIFLSVVVGLILLSVILPLMGIMSGIG